MALFLDSVRRLGVFATVVLLGCGGKVDGDLTDGGADSEGTDTAFVPTDGAPSGCGFGSCSPGLACSDGCNSCKCVAEDAWECTDRYCPDADPPPPPPPCPYERPADRTDCPIEGQSCTYGNTCGGKDYSYCANGPEGRVWTTKSDCTSSTCPSSMPGFGAPCTGYNKCGYKNSCGGVDTAVCNGKYWDISKGPCTTPTCPSYLPAEGSPCTGETKCGYPNGCGGTHVAHCGGSMSAWRIKYGACEADAGPPPPPPVCPSTTPSDGAACASGTSCSWNNGCGGINYGYCGSYGWSVKREPCSSSCPATKPASGLGCKSPGTTSCRYVVAPGSSCTSQCFCADDYRWACVTPPCAEVPPSFDAGSGP